MSTHEFDLFVIGAGSGGVRAARIAASHGAKVGIAEEYRVGGTCVIRGCVPKKLLVYASRFADEFEEAADFGWSLGAPTFSWPALIVAKDKEIGRLEGAYTRNLETAGVEIFHTRAAIAGTHAVKLATDGRTVSARVILIATGARPAMDPAVADAGHCITSNEVFHLEALPARVLVIGGGYIAVEFAGVFNGLGSEVTLLYRGDEILRGFDDDLRGNLHAAYEARGIQVICRQTAQRIDKTTGGLAVRLSDGRTIGTDLVLSAIGRVPNTQDVGLEAAGVNTDKSGAVTVDSFSQSSVPSIYAIGDVTNRVNLTPVAIREGHAFADTVFGGRPVAVDHANVPSAVFSTPEIGTVGLSEADARAQYRQIDIYKTRFRPMKATLGNKEERMVMKIVVDAESDRVLGVHILGPDAGEMAQLLGVAVKMGARKADFDATLAVHPTAAEELVTMRTKWQPTA